MIRWGSSRGQTEKHHSSSLFTKESDCHSKLRPAVSPGLDQLKCPGRSQYPAVIESVANDLQSHRQVGLGPASRNTDGRLSGQVDRIGKAGPLQISQLLSRKGIRIVLVDCERWQRPTVLTVQPGPRRTIVPSARTYSSTHHVSAVGSA